MSPIDQRDRLDEEPFDYRAAKNGTVQIMWFRKVVKTLKGPQAQAFLDEIVDLEGKEAQLLMARLTGNFKRGNERLASKHQRNR